MTNAKYVFIGIHKYNLKELSKQYNLTYSSVKKFYNLGYRNNLLLEKAKKAARPAYRLNGNLFHSRNEAAKYYQIAKSTLYRKANSEELGTIERCVVWLKKISEIYLSAL